MQQKLGNHLSVAFVTGKESESVIFFSVFDTTVSGADLFGSTIDGSLIEKDAGYQLDISLCVPEGVIPVQGTEVPKGGLKYEIYQTLPSDYYTQPYVRLETTNGPLNVRFQFLRKY